MTSSSIIQLATRQFFIFVPFTGGERTCWDCGAERQLMLAFDLETMTLQSYKDVCDVRVRRP